MRPMLYAVLALALLAPVTRAATLDIRDFGATANDETLDTEAINAAIEQAAAAGGGTVVLPAGRWVSGTIWLKSHVRLMLEAGCVLASAPQGLDAFGHPEVEVFTGRDMPEGVYQDFGHTSWRNGLLVGIDVTDITIEGPGKIDGRTMRSNPPHGDGGKAIALKNCRRVTLRDFTIDRAGHFAILPTGVDGMTIDNLTIDVERDGINLDCCKNVRITNCIINSDDDGLCLKSSYALGRPVLTENVTVANCVFTGYHQGSLLDGSYDDSRPFLASGAPIDAVGDGEGGGAIKRISRIKFGTESNGGFRNITIQNVTFEKTWSLALQTVDGGLLENVTVNNLTAHEIAGGPIFIRLGRRMRAPDEMEVGRCRNIVISNVVASVQGNRYPCVISGLPGRPIENLTLSNIDITYEGGAGEEVADRDVPENETGGPSITMFGDIPAYACYVRHAENVVLDNVSVRTRRPDMRPAFIFDGVRDLTLETIDAGRSEGARPSIIMKDTTLAAE